MTPYFVLLLLPSLYALGFRRRISWFTLLPVFIAYLLFVGLRGAVGPDTFQYLRIHGSFQWAPIEQALDYREPLSYLLFWLSQQYTEGNLLTNLVAAGILLYGVFSFARVTANPWLAIIAATPYLIIVTGMSAVRQSLAVGIIMLMLSQWHHSTVWWRFGLVFLAALFHNGAMIMAPVILINWPGLVGWKRMGAAAVGVAVLGGLLAMLPEQAEDFQEAYEVYQQRYLSETAKVSGGALHIVLLVAFPALLGFIYRERIRYWVPDYSVYMTGVLICLGLFVTVFIAGNMARRTSMFFYFVPMLTYPALTWIFGPAQRQALTFAIIVLNFFILFTWLVFANHAEAYLPYQNVLFETDDLYDGSSDWPGQSYRYPLVQ